MVKGAEGYNGQNDVGFDEDIAVIDFGDPTDADYGQPAHVSGVAMKVAPSTEHPQHSGSTPAMRAPQTESGFLND